MAFLFGFTLVAALGCAHFYGLQLVRRFKPDAVNKPQASIMAAFIGLLGLHSLEILAVAAVLKAVLSLGLFAQPGGNFEGSWQDLIYFSGINFTTLGYTQIQATGAFRIVNMMLSLGGFMVLTWSATFLYSVSARAWRS